MTDMTPNESYERFQEGMKRAVSRARELGEAQKNADWNKIAFRLECLLDNGRKLFLSKALSRQAALKMIEERSKKMEKDLNG